MFAALLTTVFYSLSAIFAHRSIRAVGAVLANLGRLIVAFVLLGAYAHLAGNGFHGAGRDWFVLSGIIGIGLGDLASFAALPLLGSRLTVLMVQCIATPIAMLMERLWLGTVLRPVQVLWSFVILAGVAVALLPSRKNPPRVPVKAAGFVFGLLTAAYQRVVGGLAVTLAFFAVRALLAKKSADETAAPVAGLGKWLWVPANALCGAVIGVSCYQWSLATTPSGIVLPIVATTPLVIVPLSYWLEGEIPTRRSFIGGVIAVTGVVALAVAR